MNKKRVIKTSDQNIQIGKIRQNFSKTNKPYFSQIGRKIVVAFGCGSCSRDSNCVVHQVRKIAGALDKYDMKMHFLIYHSPHIWTCCYSFGRVPLALPLRKTWGKYEAVAVV